MVVRAAVVVDLLFPFLWVGSPVAAVAALSLVYHHDVLYVYVASSCAMVGGVHAKATGSKGGDGRVDDVLAKG